MSTERYERRGQEFADRLHERSRKSAAEHRKLLPSTPEDQETRYKKSGCAKTRNGTDLPTNEIEEESDSYERSRSQAQPQPNNTLAIRIHSSRACSSSIAAIPLAPTWSQKFM